MAGKFEISKAEIIAASQAHETKASAEKGIEAVKTHAPGARTGDLTERGPAHHWRVSPSSVARHEYTVRK